MSNKTDAMLDARRGLPHIETDDQVRQVRHIRLYVDDSLILEIDNGCWNFIAPNVPWQSNIGLLGDDGWLFFEDKADGVIINRVEKWKKPVPSTYFKARINAIGAKIKTLVAR